MSHWFFFPLLFIDDLQRKPKFPKAFIMLLISLFIYDFTVISMDVGVVTGVAASVVLACAHDLGSHVSAWSFPDLLIVFHSQH